ncbi:hypothetical protein ACT048_02240 [Ectopseudomonas khazarica]|uniref:hypothetical protein n=1 Tax=Ectopseudomonas khazarica TaxID=2502979 RepID=UPI0040340904
MSARRGGAIALLVGAQLVLAALLYSGAFEACRQLLGTLRRDIGYGVQLQHSLYLFTALALFNAIWLMSCRNRRSGLAGCCVCLSLWTLYWVNLFTSMPLRSLLVVTVGVLVLALPACLLALRFRSPG